MQLNTNYLNEYAPNIQAFAPMIENLSEQERFSLIKMIENIPFTKKEIVNPQKKKSPLDYKYFDVIYISEDFNDDLGDEFWLGKDA